jgi:DNA-binding MarR family transcriptional regulator
MISPAEIVDQAIEVLDAVLYLDKKQIVESSGVRLHPSETHLLMCALDGSTFTAIGRRFGISTSAVSQVFSRLSAKGVVVVDRDLARKNAAAVTLTPLGETLRSEILALREHLGEALAARLSGYSVTEMDVLSRFVADLQGFISESLSNLSVPGGRK